MKVFLNGEYGVVINSDSDRSNFYGIIRWDTEKEDDSEDWRGMLETFTSIGGKIIDINYQFKFINDDGTSKSRN
ncbi:hypothetical protein [Flavobacterium sp. KACC 22761]|uniref:hypothetical protein n=1 Tax=Flavobacterium sp. KACC 22761 TaxID=3092665 RepID=UPI002A75E698|nr:hypothetical protein [Flavobacterium sp. KACC 22761]WPO77553.1 hypothetical protein SCB73_14885 [Flavobacterium sp. KACC 22761]